MGAVYNKDLMAELTHIKVILIGDGSTESIEGSIQYRLMQVETKVNSNGESLWAKFKKIPMGRKITILIIGIPFIGSYWDQFFNMIQGLLKFIQDVPK